MLVLACSSCGRENRVPAARLDAKARCGQCKAALLPLAKPFAARISGAMPAAQIASSLRI